MKDVKTVDPAYIEMSARSQICFTTPARVNWGIKTTKVDHIKTSPVSFLFCNPLFLILHLSCHLFDRCRSLLCAQRFCWKFCYVAFVTTAFLVISLLLFLFFHSPTGWPCAKCFSTSTVWSKFRTPTESRTLHNSLEAWRWGILN